MVQYCSCSSCVMRVQLKETVPSIRAIHHMLTSGFSAVMFLENCHCSHTSRTARYLKSAPTFHANQRAFSDSCNPNLSKNHDSYFTCNQMKISYSFERSPSAKADRPQDLGSEVHTRDGLFRQDPKT